MEVIEGTNVDLISPFPQAEIKRLFGWTKAYKQYNETDYDPHTLEHFTEITQQKLQVFPSWGVIDKNHLTNDRHPAPLVGMILFERVVPTNGYFHVATTRRVWGTKLIDEAVQDVVDFLFTNDPCLTRLSAWFMAKNHLARGLAQRLHFVNEGILFDMVVQNGVPKNVVHYGLTKESWKCQQQSSVPCLDLPEVPLEPLVEVSQKPQPPTLTEQPIVIV